MSRLSKSLVIGIGCYLIGVVFGRWTSNSRNVDYLPPSDEFKRHTIINVYTNNVDTASFRVVNKEEWINSTGKYYSIELMRLVKIKRTFGSLDSIPTICIEHRFMYLRDSSSYFVFDIGDSVNVYSKSYMEKK